MREYDYLDSIIGKIVIETEGDFLVGVNLKKNIDTSAMRQNENNVIKETKRQLEEYFCGKRKIFDLPIAMNGTAFQKKVWSALLEIPYGQTRSYKEIAVAVNNPKGSRAVGMANNRNPIFIIVPCHRVIGADGSLVGYGGGLDVKKKLLDLEKR